MLSNINQIDALELRSTAMSALHRAAAAVSHPGGATLFDDLVRELAGILGCEVVFVATFADTTHTRLRTLAAVLDGRLLARFEYVLEGTPCAAVIGREFRLVPQGVCASFPAGSLFGAKGMDAYAGYPLNDSAGTPLGMLVAMSRAPMRDAALSEALLKIFAARVAAEIERERADEALRSAALAVSSTQGMAVFAELMRYLATILRVDMAFIALPDKADPGWLDILALHLDGQTHEGWKYAIAGTPCETVLGQRYRVYASGLAAAFPGDADLIELGAESYAGCPLADSAGATIGLISVVSRRPLANLARLEAMLQIFAVRAAAEIERQRAEEALRRSEASYRAIFDASENSIFIHDWDSGAVVDVNPKACESHGYSRDELCGLTVGEISTEEPAYTQPQALRKLELAKQDRCPPFEWHRRNKDGSLHWDEVTLKPVEIGGKPYIVAFSREITERKAAEEALKLREEQYRVIFEAASDAFVLRDSRLRVVDVNPAFRELYGFTREQLSSETGYPEGFPSEYVEERRNRMRSALAGQASHVETTALRADGTRFEADLRVIPVRHRGEPHVLQIVRDITERKRAEADLRLREEQYRAIFDGSTDALMLWSRDIRIVDINKAATQMFGYAREEIVGGDFGNRLPPPDVAKRIALIERALAGHEGQMEASTQRKNGEVFDVELRYLPIVHRGEPHVLAVTRDITARRRAQAERAELDARLRQAQKMEAIGQLTGGIAHDFNNILTSVIGYLVLAGERAAPLGDARLVYQLEQAHVAAQRARDFVAQMLTFARRERGERHALALPALVRRTVQLLRATLPSTIELDADTDDATPPVQADAVQLEQVLFNLCINARDAIGERSGHIRVRLRESAAPGCHCASCLETVSSGPWVELSVTDSGSGITPQVLERMFDPFYTTKEVGRGSGMGLAMVHGIVHDHGGHLCVDTRPGAGSRFAVLLPRAAANAASLAAARRQAPARAPLAGRVLLVEDEKMVGELMTELLESWGLDVVLQRDAARARDWLADPAQAFDLLITDQTMPRLTGIELARCARQARPTLPVLLYTGNAADFDAETLRSSGVSQALRKPIDPDRLRGVLANWLEARGDTASA
jgi:PAS domain S-box-containing protein